MAEQMEELGERKESNIPENVVYIGKKPAMNYVLAVVTQFNNGAKNVKIRARGNTISRAVDVTEIARNRFVQDALNPSTERIAIGSEELSNEDGTKSKVSTIQILLSKDENPKATEQEKANTVYIGKKPTMNYVLAVVTQINNGANSVFVKARGNTISKAVDVAEITRSRFVSELKNPSSPNLAINSEELQNEDGTKSKVSTIEITLSK